MWVGVHATTCLWELEDNLLKLVLPSTKWVTGIELGASGLVAATSTS